MGRWTVGGGFALSSRACTFGGLKVYQVDAKRTYFMF